MLTILGASGFIGRQLAMTLKARGTAFQAIGRHDALPTGNLGDVIYCVGVTADFRSRLYDTVEAHVCGVLRLLRASEFESLLYLSSTRLYRGADSTREDAPLRLEPQETEHVYNISKAMGESLVSNCGRRTRIARISNVYGPDFTSHNFLPTILRQVVRRERIVLHTPADAAKDYIDVVDVVDSLIKIATRGRERIYNVASGITVCNGELAQRLHALTGCDVEFASAARVIPSSRISVDRLRTEFGFTPSSVLDDLPRLLRLYEGNGWRA